MQKKPKSSNKKEPKNQTCQKTFFLTSENSGFEPTTRANVSLISWLQLIKMSNSYQVNCHN